MSFELEFFQRLLLSMAAGALIGIEREYSKRQQTVGVRSFALVSLLGCLSVLLSEPIMFALPIELPFLPYIGLLVVIGYAFMIYYFLAKKNFFGITTTLALPLAYIFGMFIGYGYFLAAIIGTVVTTLILYSQRYSHMFVQQLTEEEVADALRFAIVLFIAYPLIGNEPLALFGLVVPLKQFVELIILVSFISFVGFVSVRFAGQKAIPLTGFFAGLVSSLAVTLTLSSRSKEYKIDMWVLCAGIAAASIASIVGDIAILAYASMPLLLVIYPTLAVMSIVLLLASIPFFKHKPDRSFTMKISQPFSVISGLKFGLVYLAILLLTEYVARMGEGALIATSFFAGIASVTSVVVSLSLQVSAGTVAVNEAARGIFASLVGAWVVKSAVIFASASPDLRKKILPLLGAALLCGMVAMLLTVN